MQRSVHSTARPICQYLGLKDDSGALFSHPSIGNYCHRCQTPAIPLLQHQEAFCFSRVYSACPVYIQGDTREFPPQYMYLENGQRPSQPQYITKRWYFLFPILFSLVLAGWFLIRMFDAPPKLASASLVTHLIQHTATTVSNISGPVPTTTLTRVPARTSAPPAHALEVMIQIGDYKFLMHKILGGETFEILNQKYSTSTNAIIALNYSLKAPLAVNKVIVISPGLKAVSADLPVFEAYQVADPSILIDDLAKQWKLDPNLLRLYNACPDDCRLSAGDWLIVPLGK